MANAVQAIPEGWSTLSPVFAVKGAAQAIDFYKKALGAIETGRMMTPDGKKVAHAALKIGDSHIMLNDEFEGMGSKSPQTLGGSPVEFYIYIDNVDQQFQKALEAGGTETDALNDKFWGDRCGTFVDPFGLKWTLAKHVEDVSPAEMEKRGKEMFAKSAA